MFRWQRYFSKTAVIMESGGQDLEAQCPTTMLCVGGFVITVGYFGLFNCDKQFLFAEKRANLKNYLPNLKGAFSLKWSSCKIMMLFIVVKFCSIRIKNNKESYVDQDMYLCMYVYVCTLTYLCTQTPALILIILLSFSLLQVHCKRKTGKDRIIFYL